MTNGFYAGKYITKLTISLQPYRKLLYFFALLLITNICYRLYYSSITQFSDSATMLNLLLLVWLALLNLMLTIFTNTENQENGKLSIIKRLKNKLNQWFENLLALAFIMLTFAVILLSIRMINI